MQIIEVEAVGGGAVDEGGIQRGDLCAGAVDDGAVLTGGGRVGVVLGGYDLAEGLGPLHLHAEEGAAELVEDQSQGGLNDALGEVFELQGGEEVVELGLAAGAGGALVLEVAVPFGEPFSVCLVDGLARPRRGLGAAAEVARRGLLAAPFRRYTSSSRPTWPLRTATCLAISNIRAGVLVLAASAQIFSRSSMRLRQVMRSSASPPPWRMRWTAWVPLEPVSK